MDSAARSGDRTIFGAWVLASEPARCPGTVVSVTGSATQGAGTLRQKLAEGKTPDAVLLAQAAESRGWHQGMIEDLSRTDGGVRAGNCRTWPSAKRSPDDCDLLTPAEGFQPRGQHVLDLFQIFRVGGLGV